jgi:6-phosphogluconolactonase/glucosamine-6-phosphate isomerase/deaminase
MFRVPSRPELRVVDDPAAACAQSIARRLRGAVRGRGSASLAVSGGSSAPPMFDVLAGLDVPWKQVAIWQVDERVAPDGDPDRNAGQLVALPGRHRLMPVTAKDLPAACRRYARTLPERFDVVHLGMGDDGHTASWTPGDPVIDSPDPVALSAVYQGRVRMTLTPPVVNAARSRLILTFGADKADALAGWDGPVSRVKRSSTVVFADHAAAGRLDGSAR